MNPAAISIAQILQLCTPTQTETMKQAASSIGGTLLRKIKASIGTIHQLKTTTRLPAWALWDVGLIHHLNAAEFKSSSDSIKGFFSEANPSKPLKYWAQASSVGSFFSEANHEFAAEFKSSSDSFGRFSSQANPNATQRNATQASSVESFPSEANHEFAAGFKVAAMEKNTNAASKANKKFKATAKPKNTITESKNAIAKSKAAAESIDASDANEQSPATELRHAPVLLNETLALLKAERGGRFLDGTFGGGGHSRAILKTHPENFVVALDCDPEAIERAEKLRAEFPNRFEFKSLNFKNIDTLKQGNFDGILLDLGVSSFQLDKAERGFSWRQHAKVDMRMNPNEGLSASEWLQQASEAEILRVLREYGEEPRAKAIAKALFEARGSHASQYTDTLAKLIAEVASPSHRARGSHLHPATRSFQGIRIAVNDELQALQTALPVAFDALRSGGVLATISFHSLEDRIIKRRFRQLAGKPEHKRDSRPQQSRTVQATFLTHKPLRASESELRHNPRARSAKLRALRKLSHAELT